MDLEGQRGVGEALLEELPVGVLIEALGVGLRAVGDEQVAAVAAAGGPDHEVADLVVGAGAAGEPCVDLVLGDVGECQTPLPHGGKERGGQVDPGVGPANAVLEAGPAVRGPARPGQQ
ncbi:hypothetical protein [Streptomyces sp. rh34]|uniref:hypothetical protein n=1 Tax=Streptomyces sp. rh34 TaxID=2034272 RepID=UPI000BF19DDD|nr:hypothetical protein [Streptomyces sp. rh34]